MSKGSADIHPDSPLVLSENSVSPETALNVTSTLGNRPSATFIYSFNRHTLSCGGGSEQPCFRLCVLCSASVEYSWRDSGQQTKTSMIYGKMVINAMEKTYHYSR